MNKRPATPIVRWRKQWRNADPAQRRRLITDVALCLLNRKGLEAVTVRRVAQDLGVGAMTLYTYFKGQDDLYLAIIRRGFELLADYCQAQSESAHPLSSLDGARRYLQFAQKHPRLYGLMFNHPINCSRHSRENLNQEFEPFLGRVRETLAHQGWKGAQLEQMARGAAGRHWITLHGLASLAIAGHLEVLGAKMEDLLNDLMSRCAYDLPISHPRSQ